MATHAESRSRAGAKARDARGSSIFKDYALAWVLLALFLGAWALQFYTGWMSFVSDAREHGEAAELWGRDGYAWHFGDATFENWQSEFLQLFTFVVLTSFLIFKGSPESKSSDEEMQQAIEKLTDEVKALRQSVHAQK